MGKSTNYLVNLGMEPKMINIAEWELFGEGGVGQAYIRKDDDSILLKLNYETWPLQKAEAEYKQSKAVCDLGLPCPAIYDLVTDGKRFGYTTERINGKVSLSRMIAAEPKRMHEFAEMFAKRAKELHTKQCNTEAFPSTLQLQKDILDKCTIFPDKLRAELESTYAAFDQSATTCLHGDFHMGNMIVAGGKEYWIDLGTFSYGDPLIDLGNLYMIGYYIPTRMAENLFHMKIGTYRKFMKEFFKCYFGDDLSDETMLRIRNSARFRCALAVAARPNSAVLFMPLLNGQRIKFAIVKFIAGLAKAKI